MSRTVTEQRMRWIIWRYAFHFLLAGMVLVASGCGGGEGEGESSIGPDVITSTDDEGEPVRRSSQLIGTWFSEADFDLVGIEFIDGDKVMLMYGQRGRDVVTMDYNLLDGGRLSLVAPGGMTMLFNVEIAGDRLHMAEVSESQMQPFRRLAKDETVASALEAK